MIAYSKTEETPGLLTPKGAQAIAEATVAALPELAEGDDDAFIAQARSYIAEHYPDLTEYDISAVVFRALRGPRRRRARRRVESVYGRPAPAPALDPATAEVVELFDSLTDAGKDAVLNLLRTASREHW